MKKEAILIVFSFLVLPSAFSQVKRYSGVVIDKETHLPIAWAHLLLKANGTGTVSNAEGQFSINVPVNVVSPALKVSMIGYKGRSIVLPAYETTSIKIPLEPDTRLLNEVVIKPTDVRELILEAVRKIPQNYPGQPTMLTGFYRESLRYDSVNYIYISEATLRARKESYEDANHKGQVKILKARKKEFEDSLQALKKIHFYAGPHVMHRRDFVINRFDFVNESKIKNYVYTIEKITSLNDQEIYEISFEPIAKSCSFQGTLFLDVSSGAFIRATVKLTDTGLQREKRLGEFSRFLSREFLINYMQIENKKWVIQNIWQQGSLKINQLDHAVTYANEFVTTEVDTTDTWPISYDERFQYRDFFIEEANNLDPAFWENFNILKENDFIRQIQDRELNAKSLSTDYSPAINNSEAVTIKRRIKYSVDLGLLSIFPGYSGANVNLTTNDFNTSAVIKSPDPVIMGLYSSLDIQLKNDFILGLGSTGTFGKLAFDNISLGIGHTISTKIGTRPFYVINSVGFSYNNLRLPLGEIEVPLTIKGKKLDNDIDVRMQKIYYSIQPSVKLWLELTHKWNFFVTANFLLNVNTQDRILFKEKDGFFLTRKSASLKTTDSSLDFSVNGVAAQTVPISINPIFLCTGITFKYNR